jgi:hypothetical protein
MFSDLRLSLDLSGTVVASCILTFGISPNHPHAGGVENRVGDGGSRQDRIDFAGTIGAIGSRVHDTPDFAAA